MNKTKLRAKLAKARRAARKWRKRAREAETQLAPYEDAVANGAISIVYDTALDKFVLRSAPPKPPDVPVYGWKDGVYYDKNAKWDKRHGWQDTREIPQYIPPENIHRWDPGSPPQLAKWDTSIWNTLYDPPAMNMWRRGAIVWKAIINMLKEAIETTRAYNALHKAIGSVPAKPPGIYFGVESTSGSPVPDELSVWNKVNAKIAKWKDTDAWNKLW